MSTDWKWISRKFPPLEDRRFVLGRGRYVNDITLPGMLHAAMVKSPHAHAIIRRIETSRAERVPGVVKVIVGEDLPEYMNEIPQNLYLPNVAWYPLAIGKARFAGEWVAAVVATNRYIAEDAAELVDVEYEPLRPVVDPEEAMKPSAPVLHEKHGSNVAFQRTLTFGDVDEAFAGAPHVFEGRWRWNRHSGVPIETFGSIASWDEISGIMDVWASQQNPQIAEQISSVMRIPTNKVRVHMDVDIGGSYGNKRGRKQIFFTCVASKMLGRPVKFIEDRLENMSAGDAHGPDRIWKIKVASDGNGKILALDLTVIDDAGAYAGRGAMQVSKPLTALVGPYTIPAVRYTPISVLTCKTNQAPYNGFGQSPTNFAVERAVDLVARNLNIDRAEIRFRNLIQADQFPYEIPTGATYDSGDYPTVLKKALNMASYEKIAERKAEALKRGKLLGVGVATCIEPSAGGGSAHQALFNNPNMIGGGDDGEGVRLQVDVNGNITATIGFQSAGQGHETTVTQLVCDALQVDPSKVLVVRADTTGGVPSIATTASRMHLMMGAAVLGAADKIRQKMTAIAAQALNADPTLLQLRDGEFVHKLVPRLRITFADVARIAYRRADLRPANMEPSLVETYVYRSPKSGQDLPPDPNAPFHTRGFVAFAFAAHLPIVEVDPETFEIKLVDYYIVHDCGVQINPQIVEGMVYGGTMRGIDAALLSQYSYDENGQLLTQTFMDHLLSTAMEVPHITLGDHCTPAPGHPLGAKGCAEGGYMTAPAAVVSAVEDALSQYGLFLTDIPVTPHKLYEIVRNVEELGQTAPGR